MVKHDIKHSANIQLRCITKTPIKVKQVFFSLLQLLNALKMKIIFPEIRVCTTLECIHWTKYNTRDLKGRRVDSSLWQFISNTWFICQHHIRFYLRSNICQFLAFLMFSSCPFTYIRSDFAQCILLWNSIYLLSRFSHFQINWVNICSDCYTKTKQINYLFVSWNKIKYLQ